MRLYGELHKPLVMAHRGDPSRYPENTLLSFQAAVNLSGVDFIETDSHLTKDNRVVIFHDDTIERTTNGQGRPEDLSLDQLKALDIAYNFQVGKEYPNRGKEMQILTLEEFFNAFPKMPINIDIKTPEKRAVDIVGKIICDYQREESIVAACFYQPIIEYFRKHFPTIKTSAGPKDVKNFIMGQMFHLGSLLHPQYTCFQVPVKHGNRMIVTPQFVKSAHKKGLAVHVWTINEEEEMKKLIQLGVDGIFTDNPALLIATIKQFSGNT